MTWGRSASMLTIGLAVALAATSVSAARKVVPAALAAHHWDLVGWTGHQVPEGKRLRLDFDAGRRSFSTDTMCNRASGAYRVRGR